MLASRTRQQGHVSVFIIPVLAAILLLLLGAISQSVKLQQRWHVQTAADNMAMSAAVLMAREMNLQALINRARISNQLLAAQLLGFRSWFAMTSKVVNKIATVLRFVPALTQPMHALIRVIRQVDQAVEQMVKLGLIAQQSLDNVYTLTQVAIRASFGLLIPSTLTKIAQHHGLSEQAWQLLGGSGLTDFHPAWAIYLRPTSSNSDDGRLEQIMRASTDPFTEFRSYLWADIPLIKVPKKGGAELRVDSRGKWHWQALDTVTLEVKGVANYSLGWGAATKGNRITHIGKEDFGHSGGKGAKRRVDVHKKALRTQRKLGNSVGPLRYIDRRDFAPSEWPAVIVRFAGAVAKAGVSFSRPSSLFPREDRIQEQANLFNPLWQAELQSLTPQNKLILSQVNHVDAQSNSQN
ncbi:hypothetical protein NOG12_11200 [Pseudidiomarina sp. GXY010]|uniref:Flp pilus-assembly TadG-like N-terminal domain-containing protein n=1 Tax=Pseudidiomarina fusca TaxID=2965078 RepID=A0ABU3KYR5_9GAMM|nr:hypothetical protein [Pseudidiomarina sp. GXY010]MDT7526644.1 hypothetical protein [Pseudidiomarina sp. GXY010]